MFYLQKLNWVARIKRSGMAGYFCSLLIQFHFICILLTETHRKKRKRELKRFVQNSRSSIFPEEFVNLDKIQRILKRILSESNI